ncbi:MAG: universal stress protein [Rickettsiales bacterium]|nr:universal stress protein [Rickettsiales bacterium]
MTETTEKQKYLVCVANSDVSRKALRFACMKAAKRNISIDVLHVMPPIDVQTLQSVADKMLEEQRAEAEELLKSMADEAQELTGIKPTLLIRSGNPAEEILAQTQEDYFTNMLVLGVSPGSNSGRRVISWLSNHSGTKLLIPMMLVPGNLTDEQMESLA